MKFLSAALSVALLGWIVACSSGGSTSGPRTRIVLEPQPDASVANLDDALDQAAETIKKRLKAFGVEDGTVVRAGTNQIIVEIPGVSSDAPNQIGRTAALVFCEPATDSAGNVAVLDGSGAVQYEPGTCEPVRNPDGEIAVTTGSLHYSPWNLSAQADPTARDHIVWQPATGLLNGVSTPLSGQYLKPTSQVMSEPITGKPLLTYDLNEAGAEISGSLTERLSRTKLPLAFFVDGKPIRGDDNHILAPTVQSKITTQGQITGMSLDEARNLSKLLNTGAFPMPMRIVDQEQIEG